MQPKKQTTITFLFLEHSDERKPQFPVTVSAANGNMKSFQKRLWLNGYLELSGLSLSLLSVDSNTKSTKKGKVLLYTSYLHAAK